MNKKLPTIKLQGKEYATVPIRIKEFREVCPKGLIETTPTFQADGSLIFRARVLKDKSDQSSGEATGNSRGFTKSDKGIEIPKAFEKLETIAIGRALAILGFMASGEVASYEEMEEFLSEKELKRQSKIEEIKDEVDEIKDLSILREYFKNHKGYGIEVDSYIINKSKELDEKII